MAFKRSAVRSRLTPPFENIKFSILNIHYLKILNLVFRMLNYFELRTRVFNSGLAFFCDIWTLSQIGSQTRQDFADLRAF